MKPTLRPSKPDPKATSCGGGTGCFSDTYTELDWTGLDWTGVPACVPACHRPPVRVLWVVANRSGTVINFATARVFFSQRELAPPGKTSTPTSECTIKDG